MAKPNQLVRARPDLAAAIMGYPIMAAQEKAIAYKVMPVKDVPTQKGDYGDIPAAQLLTPGNRKRNGDGSYQRRRLQFGDRKWKTSEFGGEQAVDDRESAIYDYFDHERLAAQTELFGNVLDAEIRVANKLMNVSNFTGRNNAVAVGWSDWEASNPIEDLEGGKDQLHDNCAMHANTGWCSHRSLRNLKHNTKIIERITASGAGDPAKPSDVTIDMLKQVLGLDYLFVGEMSYNAANENEPLDARPVWSDDYFGLGVIDHSGSIENPTFCRCFHWSADGSVIGGHVEDYEDPKTREHIVRVRHDTDEQIVMEDLGWLLTGLDA